MFHAHIVITLAAAFAVGGVTLIYGMCKASGYADTLARRK